MKRVALLICLLVLFGCGDDPKVGEIWGNCPHGRNPFKPCIHYEVLAVSGDYVKYASVKGEYTESCNVAFFKMTNDKVNPR